MLSMLLKWLAATTELATFDDVVQLAVGDDEGEDDDEDEAAAAAVTTAAADFSSMPHEEALEVVEKKM